LAGIVSDRDQEEAQALYDELLALIAQHPEERFPGAFMNLADFALLQGDYERARDFSEQSRKLYDERGEITGVANSGANLGLALLGLGQTGKALEHLREALRLHESIEDMRGTAMIFSGIAAALAERGEIERAIRLLAVAELIFEETEAKLTGVEAILHQRTLARARAESADFEAEWSRGRSMAREQALAEALEHGISGSTEEQVV
jgi:tetratricopeptide (TPR) repeat protein